MAAEVKSKKRKSADLSSVAAKKSKKLDGGDLASAAPLAKQPKQAKTGASNRPTTDQDGAVKSKSTRKHTPQTLEDDEDGGVALQQPKKAKSTKKDTEEKAVSQVKTSKSKHGPKAVPHVDGAGEAADESDDDIDDQTAALLKGFESSSEDEEASQSGDDAGIDIEQLPEPPKKKGLQKQLEAASKETDAPGVIYVGRIPHGFYEHQMKAYFTQFGDINRLRLARNKKTGQSRHFAFIEFQSGEVAEIVAKTMNNYLLFQHLLKVRVVPAEQVHKDLFKGAGTRFKVVPRNKIEGRHLRLGMDREAWERRLTREEARRDEKSKKLKAMGYEFALPVLKGVGDVPLKASVNGEQKQIAGDDEGQERVILEGEQDGTSDPATDRRDEEAEEDAETAMHAPGTHEQAAGKKSKGARLGIEGVKAKKQKSAARRAGGSMAVQKA